MDSRLILGRASVIGVWLYQGLWCKVLNRDGSHRTIVEKAPGLMRHAPTATRAIGLGEIAIAAWILTGWRPRSAAVVQSVAVVAMNVGGLRWARAEIRRPDILLGRNALFLALVRLTALPETTR